MQKFNLALVPQTKNKDIINLVQLFQVPFYSYQLGAGSHSHVTIAQFYTEEHKIDKIWEAICSELGPVKMSLTFSKLSHITFDDIIFWVSLLPDNCDRLFEMNHTVSSILKLNQKRTYDPHLTLFNTKYKGCDALIQDVVLKPIRDDFNLVMATCDEVGQVVDIIRS